MVEVDFHLRRAGFVRERIDVDLLRFAEVVNLFEERVELVDRVDAVSLTAGLGPARAPDWRYQRIIRIGIHLHQEKFQLRRHDGAPTALGIEIKHAPQHCPWRDVDGALVGIDAIMRFRRA